MDDELHGQMNDTTVEPSPDGSYQVGYGKPPKETRFKPGQSGNPKGRKKKAESVSDQATRILGKRINVTEGGAEKRLTLQEVMLTTLANKAAKGDLKALTVILDLAKSHEGQSGSMINPELLEGDSKEIIDAFLRQQAVGLKISDVESDGPDPAVPAESADEGAGFEAQFQIPGDMSEPRNNGDDDVT